MNSCRQPSDIVRDSKCVVIEVKLAPVANTAAFARASTNGHDTSRCWSANVLIHCCTVTTMQFNWYSVHATADDATLLQIDLQQVVSTKRDLIATTPTTLVMLQGTRRTAQGRVGACTEASTGRLSLESAPVANNTEVSSSVYEQVDLSRHRLPH